MGIIEGTLGMLENAGVPVAGTNEVQTITLSAAPASGTFKLEFEGFTTTALAFNVTAAAMAAALNLLPSIGAAGVGVGLVDQVYTVTFSGANMAKRSQPLITVEENTLLDAGAAAVGAVVAEGTPGVDATGLGAAAGALLVDTTNKILYINTGTAAAPTWTKVGTQT